MKNKGFTLIELLGVIIILALLILVVFPAVINSIKKNSEEADDLVLDLIYNSAELYVKAYKDDFQPINGNQYCITLKDLTGEGYLKSPLNIDNVDVTDLKSVRVTYDNGYKYELVNNTECEVVDSE
ncbi:MAG: prepilin-type N-terminal cleavage/methylation domain-containing protein [Bacilli bacterium]|nr:prepilin-type N-terminal cleavage/methylation domain-containing protein [Bacilli bacterium]